MIATGRLNADTFLDFSTDQDYLNPSPNNGWTIDRYPPAEFKAQGGVLIQHIQPPSQATSFYNYQGMAHDVSTSGVSQSYSIDLLVDNSTGGNWVGKDINAGFWGVGLDSANSISAYPIIAYRQGHDSLGNAIASGFYNFDYFLGGWSPLSGVSVNVGGWNSLSLVLNVGTGVDYYINGVKASSSVSSDSDPFTTSIGSVILNSYNFNNDYIVQWDNLSAQAVPLPAAAWMGLTLLGGVTGVGGLKRLRRQRD